MNVTTGAAPYLIFATNVNTRSQRMCGKPNTRTRRDWEKLQKLWCKWNHTVTLACSSRPLAHDGPPSLEAYKFNGVKVKFSKEGRRRGRSAFWLRKENASRSKLFVRPVRPLTRRFWQASHGASVRRAGSCGVLE